MIRVLFFLFLTLIFYRGEAHASGTCNIDSALKPFLTEGQTGSSEGALVPKGSNSYIVNDIGRPFNNPAVNLRSTTNAEEAVKMLEQTVEKGNQGPKLRIVWDNDSKSMGSVTSEKNIFYKTSQGQDMEIGLRSGARNEPLRAINRLEVEVRQPIVGQNSTPLSKAAVDELVKKGENQVFFHNTSGGNGTAEIVTTYSKDQPMIKMGEKLYPLSSFDKIELKSFVPIFSR